MKKIKVEFWEEQKLLINCIMNTDFLEAIKPLIRIDYFESEYSKILIKWIFEYYEKYKKAPETDIQDIFIQNKSLIYNEETVELIAKFLVNLNNIYKKGNFTYNLDQAEKWIKLQNLKRLKEKLEQSIVEGNVEKGELLLANFERVKLPKSDGVFLLKDKSEIINAFLEENDNLFSFRGALGVLLGKFGRGDLISFLGFTNRGKTWWQWYLGYEAMTHGLNVVFITLEMTLQQMVRRAWIGLLGKPVNPQSIQIPIFEYDKNMQKYRIVMKEKEFDGVDFEKINKIQKKFRFQFRGGEMVIQSFPAFSASITDIEMFLNNLDYYDNFTPDVIIIDYADIIKPNYRGEYRHQLDGIWKQLRGLAQKRNALVVTATQSTRKGALKDVSETEVAEDIRKLNHVSKMIALNQTKEEQEYGIMRIKELKKRNEKRDFREVVVLQCLDIGRVYLNSKFLNEVYLDEIYE